MKRSFDSELLNKILNHPEVYPWVASVGSGNLDLTEIVKDEKNILLMNEHGGFLFIPKGEGVYEVHTQFIPGSGKSFSYAKEAAQYMFGETDCVKLVTYVPVGNDRAKRLVDLMGFHYDGNSGTWQYPNGEEVELSWFSLTKENFLCQQQP